MKINLDQETFLYFLLVFQEHSTALGIDEIISVAEKLRSIYLEYEKKSANVCCGVIRTIGALLNLKFGTSCFSTLRQFFALIISQHDCPIGVRSYLIRSLQEAGIIHITNSAFLRRIVAALRQFLRQSDILGTPAISASCLDAIGDLCSPSDSENTFAMQLWRKFERDASNDIRVSVFRMLRKLVSRGLKLDLSM